MPGETGRRSWGRERGRGRPVGLTLGLLLGSWAGLLPGAAAGRAGGPGPATVSPPDGFATSLGSLDVDVRLPAPGAGRSVASPRTLSLMLDGLEVGRLDLPEGARGLDQRFTVDLSGVSEGLHVLEVEVLDPGDQGLSPPVTVSVDRSPGDGVVVGEAGGVVLSDDGTLVLRIPQGALAGAQTISVRRIIPGDPAIAAAYQLEPDGLTLLRPATFEMALGGSPVQPDGSLVGPLAQLQTVAGPGDPVLPVRVQVLVLDTVTARMTARGELDHFSTLQGTLAPGTVVTIDGLREALVVGDPAGFFDARVRVTDTAASTLDGTVVHEDLSAGPLVLIREPPTPGELPVTLGPLRPGLADALPPAPVLFRYRCQAPGVGVFAPRTTFQPRGPGGRGQANGGSVGTRKRILCLDPAAVDGSVDGGQGSGGASRTTAHTVSVVPAASAQFVGVPFTVKLTETFTGRPEAAEVLVELTEIVPGTLSPPELTASTGSGARLVAIDDEPLGPRHLLLTEGLGPPPVGFEELSQTVRYTCLRTGETAVDFGVQLRYPHGGGADLIDPSPVFLDRHLPAIVRCEPSVTVPLLGGLTQGQAEAALEELGLHLGTVSGAPSETIPAGQVSGQDPGAGTPVAPGSSVAVTLSTGP